MTTTVETLTSFVPAYVARRLVDASTPLASPEGVSFEAATFFADVSGFTPLAGRLAERGPAGAEELTRILNAYFGELISLITTHGGEAVKSAGDALLALWPVAKERGETLADATRRAAACALAVQAALDGYAVGAGLTLTLHIGIGAGEVHALVLGGVGATQRWYPLVAGDPIHQMGLAEGQAGSGEVALSLDAWRLVAGGCQGESREHGCVRLHAVADALLPVAAMSPVCHQRAAPALETFIPAPARDRLAAGHGEWLAELRRVSVLFINLLDLAQDGPATLGQAQTVLAVVQPVVDRYEGWVKEIIIDDKGAVIVAAWGLPPQAHPDDALRCVHAALAIRDGLAALGQRTAMGVTTGRAFAGPVGSDVRREYTVVGDVMNMAARLMGEAGEGILCDEATVQAAARGAQFVPLAAVQVKGHIAPLLVWRPARRQRSVRRAEDPHPVVGRTGERVLLGDALDQLARGVSATIVIEGEPGIGKSRLASDLTQRATAGGISVVVGQADAVDQATPYAAWRPMFTHLFQLDALAEAPTAERRAHVLGQLAYINDLDDVAPLLTAVVDIDLPETHLTSVMDGDARATATRRLLVRLLRHWFGSRPAVLVIEDGHWLDSASWALVHEVVEEVSPLLFVLTTRPLHEPVSNPFSRLRSLPATRRLALEELAESDVTNLICDRLGTTTVPPELAAFVWERAGGNPFYSEEIVLALRDTGAITVVDGTCRLSAGVADLRTHGFPDTVQGVVTSRIDHLPPRGQLAVKVASVIGRGFTVAAVRGVYPIAAERPTVPATLAQVEQRDLTRRDTPDGPSDIPLSYLFKHAITQDVAYDLLPFVQRRQLHRAAAEWIEGRFATNLIPYYGALIHHWRGAEAAGRLLAYLDLAGEYAARHGAYAEGVLMLTEAARMDATPAAPGAAGVATRLQRAKRQRILMLSHAGEGRLDQARQHAHTELRFLGQTLPLGGAPLVVDIAGQVLVQAAHRLRARVRPPRLRHIADEPMAAFLQGRGPLPPLTTPAESAHALRMETMCAYSQLSVLENLRGDALSTLATYLHWVNVIERTASPLFRAAGYAGLSLAAGGTGLHWIARAYARRAETLATATGDDLEIPVVALSQASYAYGCADFAQAAAHAARAIERFDRLGNRLLQGVSLVVLAAAQWAQGDLASAQRTADVAAATRNAPFDVVLPALLAHARGEGGVPLVTRGDERPARDFGGALGMTMLALQAHHALHTADRATARAVVGELQPILARMIAPFPALLAPVSIAAEVEIAVSEGASPRLGAAQALLQRTARVYPAWRPAHVRIRGSAAWARGDHAAAVHAWRQSLAEARRRKMPYEQALTHAELARALSAGSAARGRHQDAATALFQRMGVSVQLSRRGLPEQG